MMLSDKYDNLLEQHASAYTREQLIARLQRSLQLLCLELYPSDQYVTREDYNKRVAKQAAEAELMLREVVSVSFGLDDAVNTQVGEKARCLWEEVLSRD